MDESLRSEYSFILDGRAHRYSRRDFELRCRAAESIYSTDFQIPIKISHEALEMFIRALMHPEIDVNSLYIADLYCLCQFFGYSQFLCKLDEYYSKSDDKSKIIDQLIISNNNTLDTLNLEAEIVKSVEDIIKCQSFYSLPPEILTRILIKSSLSSNKLVEVIHLLRVEGKDMINFYELYYLVEYKNLTNKNREDMQSELKDPTIHPFLIDYFNQVHEVDLKELSQSLDIKLLDITNQMNDSIQTIERNISSQIPKLAQKIEDHSKKIYNLRTHSQATENGLIHLHSIKYKKMYYDDNKRMVYGDLELFKD